MNRRKVITFNLSIEEANTILTALAAQPYSNVASLIVKMQQQASEQLQNQPVEAVAVEDEDDK